MGNVISDLAAGASSGLLSGIGSMAKDLRSAFGGVDPDKAADIAAKLDELDNALQQAQMQIDLQDAKSDKWWQAGWRPFIGWVCGLGLTVQFLLVPILGEFGVVPKVPLDFSQLLGLVATMLGMGTLRTFEKKSR